MSRRKLDIDWEEPRWTPDCGISKMAALARLHYWTRSFGKPTYIQVEHKNAADKILTDADIDASPNLSRIQPELRTLSYLWDFSKPYSGQLKNGVIISKEQLEELDGHFVWITDNFRAIKMGTLDPAKMQDGQYAFISQRKEVSNGHARFTDKMYVAKVGTYEECMQTYNKLHQKVVQTLSVSRFGPDYRNGKDVTIEDICKEFPFKDVSIHKGMLKKDAQTELNALYDSMHDICDLFGMTPKEATLDSTLSIELGSSTGTFLAAYYPSLTAIHIGPKGNGSFFHEYIHALNDYLRRNRYDFAQDVMNEIKQTDFEGRSRRVCRRGKENYWGDKEELLARAGEKWMMQFLQENGMQNSFLTKDHDHYQSPLYPTDDESKSFDPGFTKIFKQISAPKNAEWFLDRYGGQVCAGVDIQKISKMLDTFTIQTRIKRDQLLFNGDLTIVHTNDETHYKDGKLYFNNNSTFQDFASAYARALVVHTPIVDEARAAEDDIYHYFNIMIENGSDVFPQAFSSVKYIRGLQSELAQRYGGQSHIYLDFEKHTFHDYCENVKAADQELSYLAQKMNVPCDQMLFDGKVQIVPTCEKTHYKKGVIYFNHKQSMDAFNAAYAKALTENTPILQMLNTTQKDFVKNFDFYTFYPDYVSKFADAYGNGRQIDIPEPVPVDVSLPAKTAEKNKNDIER